MHRVPGNWEDTNRFLVTPAPEVARSMREGMHREVRARVEERQADSIMPPEDTKEIVLADGKGGKRTLSKNDQLAEMVAIVRVLNRMDGKTCEFVRGCGREECLRMERSLQEAAERASLVGEGLSPKQEFLSHVPASLLPPVLEFYGRAGAMEV